MNIGLPLNTQLKEYYVPVLRAAKLGQDLEFEYSKLKENCQLDKGRCLNDLKKQPDFTEFLIQNKLEEDNLNDEAYFEYLFLWSFWKYADLKKFTIERIPESKNRSNPDFLVKSDVELIVVEVSTYNLPKQASTLIEINKPVISFVDQITYMTPELVADNQILTRIIGYKEIMRKITDKVGRQLNQYCESLKTKHRKILILDAFYLIADDRLNNRDLFGILHGLIYFIDHLGLDYYSVSQQCYDEYCTTLKNIQEISSFLQSNNTLLLFSLDGFNRFKHYGLVGFNGSHIFEYGHKEFFNLSNTPISGNHHNVIELAPLFKKVCDKGLIK